MLRLAVLVATASCTSETTPPAAPPPSTAPSAPEPAPPAKTSSCTLPAGAGSGTIDVGGQTREYLLHVGAELSQPPAVVFTWHGFGSKAEYSLASLKVEEHWKDAIVVAPRGLPRTFEQFGDVSRPGWQVYKGELADRDFALFDALVTELTDQGCLDPARVYTTGFSNGGFWSNVLACHRGDLLAAAAPAGGGGPFVPPCGPPIPVMITHGTEDDVVTFDNATKTLAFWSEHDGCPAIEPPNDGCAAETCKDGTRLQICAHPIRHTLPPEHAPRVAEFLRAFTKDATKTAP